MDDSSRITERVDAETSGLRDREGTESRAGLLEWVPGVPRLVGKARVDARLVSLPSLPLPLQTVAAAEETANEVAGLGAGADGEDSPRVADSVGDTSQLSRETVDVWITIYLCPPYCGLMANGKLVYDGAAACGYGFTLGQRFTIENDPTLRTYVCADRGLGGWYWVDIFWADAAGGYSWLAEVGDYGTVILR